MLFDLYSLHSAPNRSGMNLEIWSYKHIAPPEQEPSGNEDDFSCYAS
jgi:hypothetical protein